MYSCLLYFTACKLSYTYIYRFFLVLFTETSLTFIIAVSISLGTCLGSFEASSAKNKYNKIIETILIDMHTGHAYWR